ncbi:MULTISPECIES: hypothetical protein [Morganellaceae]|uniref:hypothetical protein n=1 Tax=Morganellaceae TaxID=1903414 RepID=UPI000B3FA894|nr:MULTISPECIES: hypothetical protein [Morganellaceae]EKT8411873.1 hypothetical protein [Proteus mirabilis]EKU7616832.1 hypothetical protein [Proteus mirabilis]ELI0195345.1 hypothetical protein [Proteus mirabilis]ELT7779001.1 hypothetical protein [Proteus mirabilis]MBG2830301.1 hypothetical protein [Proteus mirabilis]
MKDKLIIKSLSPAISGWWAKFVDDDEQKTVWYSPVAAWALCDVKYEKETNVYAHILPVLTSESGMEPLHPDDGYCELLYLPDETFIHANEPYCFAWHLVNPEVKNEH